MELVQVVIMTDTDGERRVRGVCRGDEVVEEIIQEDIDNYDGALGREDFDVVQTPILGKRSEAEGLLAELLEWEARMGGFEGGPWGEAKKYMAKLRNDEEGKPDETPARVEAMVTQLEEARNRKGEDVQYAVDDLIFDHCGTSKKWSNVNNQGFQSQVEALVEAVGVEETEKLVKDVAEATYP